MATQNQDRLRSHFSTAPTSSHNTRWDDLWKEGTFLPWDRSHANPALIDLVTQTHPATSTSPNPSLGAPSQNSSSAGYESLPKPLKEDGTRRKVLVPGCGKGYDVALFAAQGYDAYGLEVSSHAAEAARAYLENPEEGPLEGEYKVRDAEMGRGKMEVRVGDYFDDGWMDGGLEGGFDIIYDNTFLCALDPSLRPQWAKRTKELLKSEGTLICLEFPTHKPASSGGPPWSLPPLLHAELLKRPGEEIQYNDEAVVVASDSEESADALVRVAHWTPARTHDVGVIKGVVRDCVSLWRHKSV